MDELGHILREARETKGLTLAEVQDKIRINSRFLQALENSEYERLPTPVHVRGFLRNYARFLGLDPQPLLNRYELSRNNRPAPVMADRDSGGLASSLPLRDDQPFFDPVNVEVESGQRRSPESVLRLVIILALIGFLYLLGNRFIPLLLGNGDGTEALTEGITAAIQNITSNQGETSDPDLAEGTAVVSSGVITSTSRNNSETTPSAISSPTPTRPTLPAVMEVINLELQITERTWMEVTIDGDIVFSGIAVKDLTFEWAAQEEAKILTGNAIGVFVTINEIPLGRLGGRGESKEEVWQTTN
jgi:cytoskeletal protein RodZ